MNIIDSRNSDQTRRFLMWNNLAIIWKEKQDGGSQDKMINLERAHELC